MKIVHLTWHLLSSLCILSLAPKVTVEFGPEKTTDLFDCRS